MILYVNVYDILGCFVIYRYCNSFYRIFMFWIFVIFYNDYDENKKYFCVWFKF